MKVEVELDIVRGEVKLEERRCAALATGAQLKGEKFEEVCE
jgi:hypothetical protein